MRGYRLAPLAWLGIDRRDGGVRRRNDSELGCVNWALGYAAAPCYLERSSGNASKSIKAEHPKFPLVALSGPTRFQLLTQSRHGRRRHQTYRGAFAALGGRPLHAGQPLSLSRRVCL